MSKKMTGKQALLEMLRAEGIKFIFGNPGTSEGPIVDMLGDYPDIRYILTLQESVAVGMGESYARATGKPSFVSLHVDSGLANGIALILDAYNTGTPMVITSANYDARKITEGKTDLAELVRPVTKWAVELSLPDQIPGAIRRAFNEANSHPKGPVYVGFTSNALEGVADMNIVPSGTIHSDVRPSPSGIEAATALLLKAKKPILIVGDRVSDDGAVDQAIELAELLGLPVYQSRGAEVAFPTSHDQYLGMFSLRVAQHRKILENTDLVLAVGMDAFEELFYWGDIILSPNTKLVHIDPIPGRVGKSEPTDVGIVAHCGLALQELTASIRDVLQPSHIEAIQARTREVKQQVNNRRNTTLQDGSSEWDGNPMVPDKMMAELAKALPENAIVVDDSISNRAVLRKYINGNQRGDIRGVRGQSIGGGIGATMGTQCANPERPVFGVIGDGSAMMTIQGLWTAANDNIPCVFIICNNGMYRVLKVNFDIYQREILNESEPAGRNLLYSDFPLPFDIASIANSMGVRGERITDPGELKPAIDRAIASGKPALLDVVIDGSL
ncbi:thiamine pyrophosphate-binding protein [SAR202 cluster bacterium AD-802-E10_MRT_200m]|nr:thiamine pyrophosphate-binding protein [SAR202 cluster bacterium AD-802-E10_MRT_200m]